ncbi:LacI family DNA-binding transcriptional regulator [Klebsiella sp. R445]
MANIIDIAKKTGLSPSTVSRALSKPEKVAESTRQRIMTAIKDLGYETNIFARNLRQGGSRTIGLVVSDILNPFHAVIVKSIQDVVYREGFTLMVGSSDEDAAKEENIIAQLRSHQLQGLLIIPTVNALNNLSNFDTIPVIEIDRYSGRPQSDIVRLDNEEGMRIATQHLAHLGHTHVAYIGGSIQAETFRERLEGFEKACGSAITHQIVELPGITALYSQAFEAASQIFAQQAATRPTAIIAANNDIATGIMKAAFQQGLSMPDDISFLAFDDPEWAEFFPCPITTIRQPVYEMGQFAARQLFQRLRGELTEMPATWRFTPELIVRGSTTRPRLSNQPEGD